MDVRLFVTVAIATGQATLTSGTASAQIYYTLDESFPGPSNPMARLYETPFDVLSGDTILAAAFLSDSDDNLSRITRLTVP